MGVVCSSARDEFLHKSRQIDKELKAQKKIEEVSIKILLLGTGEAGKTTFLNQMRLMHSEGFGRPEQLVRKTSIYYELIKSMQQLIAIMNKNDIALAEKENKLYASAITEIVQNGELDSLVDELPFKAYVAIKRLWNDKNLQQCYKDNRNRFIDNIGFFFNSIDRVAKTNYIPTEQDMLLSRAETVAVVEVSFRVKDQLFRVFDVGGQRAHRKKWFNFFDDITALLFVTALSEFDQSLREADNTNRMVESLNLFETICSSSWFFETAILLFLNKKDLFAQKLQSSSNSIIEAFPDYEGSPSYESCISYISRKFRSCNRNRGKKLYVYETCATDRNQVETVIDAVVDTCMRHSMEQIGIE